MADAACALKVDGWVRNREDGCVEAFVQGDPPIVERMIAWCRHGPPGARVSAVDVDAGTPDPTVSGFATRPTGVMPASQGGFGADVRSRSMAKMSFHAAYDDAAHHGSANNRPIPAVAQPNNNNASDSTP